MGDILRPIISKQFMDCLQETDRVLSKHLDGICVLEYSPNGLCIASGNPGDGASIFLWRSEDGRKYDPIRITELGGIGEFYTPRELIFTPDGHFLNIISYYLSPSVNYAAESSSWDISQHTPLKGLTVAADWKNSYMFPSTFLEFYVNDGWVWSRAPNKRLCWISPDRAPETDEAQACYGNYYAIGSPTGKFTVFDLSMLMEE